jgi:hypothetical protein
MSSKNFGLRTEMSASVFKPNKIGDRRVINPELT